MDQENLGLGYPVAVARNTLSWPIVNIVVATLVMTGASFTTMVKFRAEVPKAFWALRPALV